MLTEALRGVPLFAELSPAELEWLALRGEELWLEAGDLVIAQGQPSSHFWVLIEGEARFIVANNGSETLFSNHRSGAFFAEAPILMGRPYFGTGHTLRRSRLFRLPVADFWEMLRLMPSTTRAIFSATAERVYQYQSMLQQQERLAALGRLSAGLAHELNNPAAAASRAADQLAEALAGQEELALRVSLCMLDDSQRVALAALRRDAVARAAGAPSLDPLARSDREEALAAHLDRLGVAEGWRMTTTLVGAGLDAAWVDHLATLLPPQALGEALSWIEASLNAAQLIAEIGESTTRISALVSAMRSYTFMDQAPEQEVDIHEGLESTLIMLHSRIKAGVTVVRSYDVELPRVTAFGSELNQVWTNLIDNAVDAMGGRGSLLVRTARDGDYALVEIADDGPGIPPAIQQRIWEPFFTTKSIGQGSGLGLDIVYRTITLRHQGDVRVRSAPGDTCFSVRLPLRRGQPGR
jgi:signal transduction histidine kinase